MRYVLIILFIFPLQCFGERIFYDKNKNVVKEKKAVFYRDIDTLKNGKLKVLTYGKKDNLLRNSGIYFSINPDKIDSLYCYDEKGMLRELKVYGDKGREISIDYYPSGNVKFEYRQLDKNRHEISSWYPDSKLRYKYILLGQELDGEVISYHPNGQLKRKELYVNGVRENEGERYDSLGNSMEFYPFREGACFGSFVSTQKCIINFRQYLAENIWYPKSAVNNKIEGRSIISFTVNREGKVVHVRLRKTSGDNSLDNIALGLVEKSPTWNPAMVDGEPANANFTLPIIFQLR